MWGENGGYWLDTADESLGLLVAGNQMKGEGGKLRAKW
jgi:hypothetical protein